MPRKLPDKYTDPEGYADEQAQRMRTARLRDEAYRRRWRRVWDAERARPIGQRRYFSFAETSERLARDPQSLVTDPNLRERVAGDLAAQVQNRRFAPGEVVILSGDPPDFQPFQLTPDAILVPDAEVLALRSEACRRYAEARAELPGAAGLLRDWFAAKAATSTAADPPREAIARPPAAHGRQAGSEVASDLRRRRGPIPKTGKITEAAKALIAEGHVPAETTSWGRFTEMLCTKLGVKPESRGYSIDSIQKSVRPLLEQRRNEANTESTESTES